MRFCLDDFTFAEIHQMWAERMRQDWQHTSAIISMVHNVNVSSKTKQRQPDEMNPMETSSSSEGIPLNSELGFQALQSVANQWQRKH